MLASYVIQSLDTEQCNVMQRLGARPDDGGLELCFIFRLSNIYLLCVGNPQLSRLSRLSRAHVYHR